MACPCLNRVASPVVELQTVGVATGIAIAKTAHSGLNCKRTVLFKMLENEINFLRITEQSTTGTRLFGPADSVWPIRSEAFRSGPLRSRDISVRAVSVWRHFGQTMKSSKNLTCPHFNANILKSM